MENIKWKIFLFRKIQNGKYKMENIPLQEMCKLGSVRKTNIQINQNKYFFHSTTFFIIKKAQLEMDQR